MRRTRLAVLAPVALLIALLGIPATALAADPVTVTGSVVRDGAPVAGVDVTISVTGGDQVVSATTDDAGVFSADLVIGVGDELSLFATGQTSSSNPDSEGCVRSETPIGSLKVTIDELPPAALEVQLDQVLSGTVCTATGKPEITPPSTDAVSRGGSSHGSGSGLVLALVLLAVVATGALAAGRRRA